MRQITMPNLARMEVDLALLVDAWIEADDELCGLAAQLSRKEKVKGRDVWEVVDNHRQRHRRAMAVLSRRIVAERAKEDAA